MSAAGFLVVEGDGGPDLEFEAASPLDAMTTLDDITAGLVDSMIAAAVAAAERGEVGTIRIGDATWTVRPA